MSQHTVQVRIVGVGINKTVTVEDGTPLSETLDEAIETSSLTGKEQVRVNGESVEPTSFTPSDGDTIVVVPPAVKLGA